MVDCTLTCAKGGELHPHLYKGGVKYTLTCAKSGVTKREQTQPPYCMTSAVYAQSEQLSAGHEHAQGMTGPNAAAEAWHAS